MSFAKKLSAGEIAAIVVGIFAFLMMGGIARHIGVNLIIAGIVGIVFFVPYWKLGQAAFANARTLRDLFHR